MSNPTFVGVMVVDENLSVQINLEFNGLWNLGSLCGQDAHTLTTLLRKIQSHSLVKL